MKTLATLSLSMFLACLAPRSHADLLYVASGTPTDLANYGDSGVSFQVTQPVQVTELAFYGLSLGGGDAPWVQLWNDSTDSLIGSVSWTAGTASAGWNSKALAAPVNLVPGVSYQVQGIAWWVPTYPDITSFTAGPAITSLSFHHDAAFLPNGWAPLAAPSVGADTSSIPSMVNMTYTVIPEPSSLALTGIALLLATLARRSRA